MAPSRWPLAAVVLMMMSRISSREPASVSFERSAEREKPIEVRLEIVDAPVDEAGRVEDAVTAVHHVIVERESPSARDR